jgi:hypothetical protein
MPILFGQKDGTKVHEAYFVKIRQASAQPSNRVGFVTEKKTTQGLRASVVVSRLLFHRPSGFHPFAHRLTLCSAEGAFLPGRLLWLGRTYRSGVLGWTATAFCRPLQGFDGSVQAVALFNKKGEYVVGRH